MAHPDPPTSDEYRCNRHDGRGWRCKRPIMDGKTLCEIHYVQGRLRSNKHKVPESLKLQRPKSNSKPTKTKPQPQPPPPPHHNPNPNTRKIKRFRPSDDEDLLPEKKTKNKAEDLLRVFVKREIERKKKRRRKDSKKATGANADSVEFEHSLEEVTRELPFGRMAISPPSAPTSIANSAASPAVKVGTKSTQSRIVSRKFRSKNIEQPPICTIKDVPYPRGNDGGVVGGGGRKKCHWCRRNDNVSLTKCLNCKKMFFCTDCVNERSIDLPEVKMRCPVCCGICECKACLASRIKDASSQEVVKKEFQVTKYPPSHYLISLVLPILERINSARRLELEMEANSKGLSLSEAEIPQVDMGTDKQLICNRCSFSILDLHRSCPNCSYKLCLSCCRTLSALMLLGTDSHSGKSSSSCGGCAPVENNQLNGIVNSMNKEDTDSKECVGSSSCPSIDLGGCGNGLLDTRCIFPLNFTEELEVNAKDVISGHESAKVVHVSLNCSVCSSTARQGIKGFKEKGLIEASERKHTGDNLLYYPSVHDDYDILLPHFQRHWRNHHPVIVRDLVVKASNFTWDPIDLFSNYLNLLLSECEDKKEDTNGANCTDWFEVSFSSKESFTGPFIRADVDSRDETLKLKAKLSSTLCQRRFKDHYARIFDALPIQEYTNPWSGLLNLAAKLEEDSSNPDVSPCMYIMCGSAEEIRRGELFSALCYCSHDLVNVLVHASDLPCSADQINKVKTLIRMKHTKDSGGWVDRALENEMAREHSELTEDAGQPDQTVERTNLRKGVGASSSCLETTVDLPQNSPTKATGSGSECDSSNVCSGTGDGHEKPDGQMSHLDSETCAVGRGYSYEKPSGIHWDIFRRQDTPKLAEYIQRHSDKFSNANGASKKASDPLLGGNIYLDSAHKMKLKEEFKVEPWTLVQKLGEAVLIPAGCPYQTRNLKSCVNIAVGFVSPESADECIKLNDKLSTLPMDNKDKASRLEVEKMVISKISKAIDEVRCGSTKCSPSVDV